MIVMNEKRDERERERETPYSRKINEKKKRFQDINESDNISH